MKKNEKVMIKRYNIYSGMEITLDGVSICVDPAKIVPEVLQQLSPDIILISHESMDHLDPTQVYYLQKKRNAKVFCSIAVAVDLKQYYSSDLTFMDSIYVMIPGSVEIYKDVRICAVRSVHCDYMMPLVFKLQFINCGISIVHCMDSLISDEIIELSNNASIGIIPIGIAKGINADSGIEFMSKMGCAVYIPNHFTCQLQQCMKMVEDHGLEEQMNVKFVPLDWNQYCVLEIPKKEQYMQIDCGGAQEYDIEEIIMELEKKVDVEENLLRIITKINSQQGKVFQPKMLRVIADIFYHEQANLAKIALIIWTMAALYDSLILDEMILKKVQEILTKVEEDEEELKVVVLFFLGIYAQQSGRICYLNEILENIDSKNEHITYWVTECLGRMSISKDINNIRAIKALEELVNISDVYESVVVRRKIYWEFLRITKSQPTYCKMFEKFYVEGLSDLNPDVRLLSILCITFMCRTNSLVGRKVFEEMSKLFEDEEDDVRETYANAIYRISNLYPEVAYNNKDKIKELVNDKNCHVKTAAEYTLENMRRW